MKLLAGIVTFILFPIFSTAQVNLQQGLVAYYPFNGNANDASGNNNHGIPTNGPQLTTDRFGNINSAYFFDGIDDFIQVLNSPSFNPSTAMSIALYFNPTRNGVQTLIGKIGYTPGLGTQFQMAMDFSLHPGVLFGVNPQSNDCFGVPLNAAYANTGGPITTNRWYCVVGTFDNGVLNIYLNGLLIESVNTGFSTLNQCPNADVQIGSWWSGDQQRFNGKIDDIRIYNRALNLQEVQALCTSSVLCTGSLGDPVVNIDFGAGNNPGQPLPTIVPGASTTLSYIAVTGNPAAPIPFDGQYTITNNVPLNGNNWHQGIDHTPNDVNGFMAFYNSQETAGLEFYRQTVSNLCGSTTYEFAAWVANCLNPAAMNGVDPNITFVIERPDGSVISAYTTGDIPETSAFTWKQYGFFFTMPTNETTVVLKMINNNVGGNALPGNDLAIDDITFRPCGPTSIASFSSNAQLDTFTVCEGDPVTFYGSLSTGYNTPNYIWQQSSDSGRSWTNLPSSNLLQYTFNTTVTGSPRTIWYRMVAGDGANVNSQNCRVRSNTIILRIRPLFACVPSTRTPISGTVNSYTAALSFDICKNSILVQDATAFNVGDTIIIAQMKGAVIDSSNSPSFGNISDYREAGNYEYNYISQKNGNELELRNVLLRPYNFTTGAVQLVRVPYYQSVTVTSTLTAQPWNGATGGILALNVRDSLVMLAPMDVSGQGFSGGKGSNSRTLASNCSQNGFTYPSGSLLAAPKGESIVSLGSQIQHGKGAPASGGGGGLDQNSGGGGGGNGGAGGFGGYQLEACTNTAFDNRGIGGRSLVYSNAQNKVFMGGGGGAGHSNQPNGITMDGGNGGGIILIKTRFLYTDGNTISANGAAAVQCNLPNINDCYDGSGGGGAGGTVLIDATNFIWNIPISTSGGAGGNTIVYNGASGGRTGPGGGGGGGVVWINSAAAPADMFVGNPGGKNGVITAANNDPWGAQSGQPGVRLYDLQLPISNTPFEKNIQSLSLTGAVINCKSVKLKSTAVTRRNPVVDWQWDFGDGATANSTADSITHTYSSDGTYTIKLIVRDANGCVDSSSTMATINIVTVSANSIPTVCINQAVVLQSNSSGAMAFAWTPARFLNDSTLQNPVATVNTSTRFFLTVSNNLGCTDTTSVLVSVHPKPVFNAPLAPSEVCSGSTLQLNGNNGNQYSYQWSPAAFLNDSTLANPVASPNQSMIFNLRVSASICNYDSSFVLPITVNPNPVVSARSANDIDCSIPTSQLSAQGADTYVWAPSTGLNNPRIANPVAGATSTTTYVVTGTNQFGCSSKDSVTVKVTNGGLPVFELPNAFTPNGDGKNDCFGIRRWGNVTIKQFSIFNRWGQLVFTTKNPFECWDGTINGKKQDTGGYGYVIMASTLCGEVRKTGIIMLVR